MLFTRNGLVSAWHSVLLRDRAGAVFWIMPVPRAWQYSECLCPPPTVTAGEEMKIYVNHKASPKLEAIMCESPPRVCGGAQLC